MKNQITKLKLATGLFLFLAIPLASAQTKENAPLNISVATTPEEFRCDALQISDFDKVNESMASLKQSIHDTFSINDSCVDTKLATPENQKNLNVLLENIQGGVSTIRGQLANQFVEGLAQIATGSITTQQAYDMTSQNQLKAKEAVKLVVGSMKELNALVEKNPLSIRSSKNCSSQYSSSERLVFGVAEMVEDVSPLLIQAVSRIPGLQELAPAVVGASMISSAITQYAEVAQKRVDINKPENRTAILINTCQLVKTYDRMRMLRGLKTAPSEEKKKLNQLMAYQKNIISQTELYQANKKGSGSNDSEWLAAADQQNQNYQSLVRTKDVVSLDDLKQVCDSKSTVIDLSSAVVSLHFRIAQLSGQSKSLQDDTFVDMISKYKTEADKESNSTEDCAKATRSLYNYTLAFNNRTFQILMDFKKTRMEKDNNFIKASNSLAYLQSFQNLLSKMDTGNLFEKLQTSIARTDSLINQSRVLEAWFGNAKNFYWPGIDQYRNPVMDLMNYHERQFLMFRKPFSLTASQFDYDLLQLYRFWHKNDGKKPSDEYYKDFERIRVDLSILNPINLDSDHVTTVTGRSSPHEKACSTMISMRNNFQSMMEAFNTLKYFCQMLRPLLYEPEISKDLRVRCLGVDDMVPNSSKSRLSGVDMLLEPISIDVKRMPNIIKKIQELKCEN